MGERGEWCPLLCPLPPFTMNRARECGAVWERYAPLPFPFCPHSHANRAHKHRMGQGTPPFASTPLCTHEWGGTQDGAHPPFHPPPPFLLKGGRERYAHPPFAPPPPLFMHKQDANMGLCRTSPTPFVPAPPFTQMGVHRMGHAPLSPATPISAQRGHRKGTPTPLLPSLHHHSCANRT